MRGESLRKPLADDAERRWLGRVIERALESAELTKQQASGQLGYENQSALSRWISGADTAQVGRLFQRLGPDFQRAFVAELSRGIPGVQVKTVVTLTQEVAS